MLIAQKCHVWYKLYVALIMCRPKHPQHRSYHYLTLISYGKSGTHLYIMRLSRLFMFLFPIYTQDSNTQKMTFCYFAYYSAMHRYVLRVHFNNQTRLITHCNSVRHVSCYQYLNQSLVHLHFREYIFIIFIEMIAYFCQMECYPSIKCWSV